MRKNENGRREYKTVDDDGDGRRGWKMMEKRKEKCLTDGRMRRGDKWTGNRYKELGRQTGDRVREGCRREEMIDKWRKG